MVILNGLPENPTDGLPLAVPTPPGWIGIVVRDVDTLLGDHAHCELKAASTAMSMAGRFPDRTALVRDLTALAHEEIRHFERVHRLLNERGRALPRVRRDRYVSELKTKVQRGLHGIPTLLDQLILCLFVEARSCERFRLLARSPLPDDLREFYAELAGAEERHHELFLRHAVEVAGKEAALKRMGEVASIEAAVLMALPLEPRIH